jgi:hypothetical protein
MTDIVAWPPGWRAIDGDEARGMLGRLQFEMPRGHLLAGKALQAIARRDGNDDVLYRCLDEADRVVVVHLTWASQPERDPEFPSVEFDGAWDAFLAAERG